MEDYWLELETAELTEDIDCLPVPRPRGPVQAIRLSLDATALTLLMPAGVVPWFVTHLVPRRGFALAQ